MTKLSTEAKPLEREMFVAREVLRLGVIRVLTMFPVDSPVRRALAEILVKTADEQFDYAAACDEYQTDPAFYNAVERIRCHLTDALLKRNDEQETQLAVMREAIRWARDELFAHGYAQGESARYDKIIKRLESALTPDDGKRVVDVVYAEEQLESAGRMNWLLPWKKRRSCDVLFDTGCDETPIVFPFTVWDRHEDDGLLHEYECRMPKCFAFGD